MSGTATASSYHLTLLIPGLFNGTGHDRARVLETMLSRADVSETAVEGFEAGLLSLFGIALPAQCDIPVAALSHPAPFDEREAGMWLCADPVHLIADQSQVYLTDPRQLPVSEAQAAALIDELNAFYAEEGWRFTMATPHRWYLYLPSHEPVRTTPLRAAIEQAIRPLLPQGQSERYWRRVMNELQMLLHNSKVNREREGAGQLPINGIWLWGTGGLPEPVERVRWNKVWSGEALAKGLARLHGLPAYGLPGSYAAWRKRVGASADAAHKGGDELLVFDVLSEPGITAQAYTEWLERLEGMWFVPLLAALQQGEIGSVCLDAMDGRRWCVTPKMAKRWWRRRRPLAVYADAACEK